MRFRRAWLLAGLVACGPQPSPPSTSPPDVAQTEPPQQQSEPVPEPTPEPPPKPYELPANYLQFTDACMPGESATVAAVGDLLLHRELQKQAFAAPDGFMNIWSNVADLLAAADVTYMNFEGPAARGVSREFVDVPDPGKDYDNVVYTGYPKFNYHPSVAKDLVKTGVDIVSTANNHALDRGPLGADRTIQALKKAGLPHVGTKKQGDEKARWYRVTKAGELSIAWIACTRHTNQVPDDFHQVLRCDTDRTAIDRLIKRLKKRESIDAIIVTPHQGKEYVPEPREAEVKRVHRFLEAGALAVLGSHPHVLQPWEKFITQDGRETFIIHSLGNFASHQPELPRRSSLILYLGFTRGEDGITRINGARYVPLHVRQEGKKFFTEAIDLVGGPADSRALTVEMFGAPNLLVASEPLVTNPHCDADWRAAE